MFGNGSLRNFEGRRFSGTPVKLKGRKERECEARGQHSGGQSEMEGWGFLSECGLSRQGSPSWRC